MLVYKQRRKARITIPAIGYTRSTSMVERAAVNIDIDIDINILDDESHVCKLTCRDLASTKGHSSDTAVVASRKTPS
jgi:hypothetical protein